jgi:hypothetical protein
MKWLFSICALACFNSATAQTMTPILIEADAGRETGVFSKSPVVQVADNGIVSAPLRKLMYACKEPLGHFIHNRKSYA